MTECTYLGEARSLGWKSRVAHRLRIDRPPRQRCGGAVGGRCKQQPTGDERERNRVS